MRDHNALIYIVRLFLKNKNTLLVFDFLYYIIGNLMFSSVYVIHFLIIYYDMQNVKSCALQSNNGLAHAPHPCLIN